MLSKVGEREAGLQHEEPSPSRTEGLLGMGRAAVGMPYSAAFVRFQLHVQASDVV